MALQRRACHQAVILRQEAGKGMGGRMDGQLYPFRCKLTCLTRDPGTRGSLVPRDSQTISVGCLSVPVGAEARCNAMPALCATVRYVLRVGQGAGN